jgi:hypothetical protein
MHDCIVDFLGECLSHTLLESPFSLLFGGDTSSMAEASSFLTQSWPHLAHLLSWFLLLDKKTETMVKQFQ